MNFIPPTTDVPRRVYRGEQLPPTPPGRPPKSLLATITGGRRSASYTITPPTTRRQVTASNGSCEPDRGSSFSSNGSEDGSNTRTTTPAHGSDGMVVDAGDTAQVSCATVSGGVGGGVIAGALLKASFAPAVLLSSAAPATVLQRSSSWIGPSRGKSPPPPPSQEECEEGCSSSSPSSPLLLRGLRRRLAQSSPSSSSSLPNTLTRHNSSNKKNKDSLDISAPLHLLKSHPAGDDSRSDPQYPYLGLQQKVSVCRGLSDPTPPPSSREFDPLELPHSVVGSYGSLGRRPRHNLSLQDNVTQYADWLKADTPKSSGGGKGSRFIRQSFKKGSKGKGGSPLAGTGHKTSSLVKTLGTGNSGSAGSASNEGVKRAVEHVQRALQFYQDTVVKEITDMLPGSATVVLDMVLTLSLALDEVAPNLSNSQRLTELQRNLHHSLAELVRWSDNFLLHSTTTIDSTTSTSSPQSSSPSTPHHNHHHQAQQPSVHTVVDNVRNAVQALVDMATKEDIITHEPQSPKLQNNNNHRHHSNNVPHLACPSSPTPSSNRNSLPEILTPDSPPPSPLPHHLHLLPPSPSTSSLPRRRSSSNYHSSHHHLLPPSTPSPGRLSHSLSSDSILHPSTTTIEEVCPPSSPTPPPTQQQQPPPHHHHNHSTISSSGSSTIGLGANHHHLNHHHLNQYHLSPCDVTSPPPLPPKRRSHSRSSSSSAAPSPLYSTNTPSSSCSPVSRVPPSSPGVVSSSDSLHEPHHQAPPSASASHNGSLEVLDSSPRLSGATNTSSPSQLSPASSIDSFNTSSNAAATSVEHLLRHSLQSPHEPALPVDLQSSLSTNFSLRASGGSSAGTGSLLPEDDHAMSQKVNHLSQHFPNFPNFASVRHNNYSSRSVSMSTHSYTEEQHVTTQQVSSSSSCTTRRHLHHLQQTSNTSLHSSNTSTSQTHLRSSTSSSSSSTVSFESDGGSSSTPSNNTHSLVVAPQLPLKQRHTPSTDASSVRLRDKLDANPELPPKKCGSAGGGSSFSSGYYSSSNSSMLSNNSSCSMGSITVPNTALLRRHTTAEPLLSDADRPPELPPKTRNKPILDYMGCLQTREEGESINEFHRHSLHQNYRAEHYQQQQLQHHSLHTDTPYLHFKHDDHSSLLISYATCTSDPHADSLTSNGGLPNTIGQAFLTETNSLSVLGTGPPPALPPKQRKPQSKDISGGSDRPNNINSSSIPQSSSSSYHQPLTEDLEHVVPDLQEPPQEAPSTPTLYDTAKDEAEKEDICAVGEEGRGVLEFLEAESYILHKKEGEDGPSIRGGTPDALIVHVCTSHKAGQLNDDDRLYQDAFLTTYRTFITPDELIEKLLYRYHKFVGRGSTHREEQMAASNAFSILVCVVEDLSISDLTTELLQTLSDFQHELLCKANFKLAKILRTSLVKKLEARKRYHQPRESLASMSVSTKQLTLLDFKSLEIAEQMTLLDAELFHKVEIPEVLLWSREPNEERSPNLNSFTDHFNKMSYWVRTRILDQSDSKDRERYVVKFIKILKHLRKLNNFNSYLALLSALDSAPIRRLEWQKTITDGLKEYCALIDSSSSFRAYRNALAESSPPCIPYIGLILQDLTFIHNGNSDFLPDGHVNFSKRWQQFHILDNMKRFRKSNYSFKKKERIVEFFNDFVDYKSEDVLWEMSKQIKPRNKEP